MTRRRQPPSVIRASHAAHLAQEAATRSRLAPFEQAEAARQHAREVEAQRLRIVAEHHAREAARARATPPTTASSRRAAPRPDASGWIRF